MNNLNIAAADPDFYDPYAATHNIPPHPEDYYRSRINRLVPHPSTWDTEQLLRALLVSTSIVASRMLTLTDQQTTSRCWSVLADVLCTEASELDAKLRIAHHRGTVLDPALVAAQLPDALGPQLRERLAAADQNHRNISRLRKLLEVVATADLAAIRTVAAEISAHAAQEAEAERNQQRARVRAR
ncbi:hypothetical protein AB0C34_17285 [Nocardia sp. NPDC049220]|uniref:hypothetical protein n=1 Tax=Nocardia sp. NPDC049220 TaxID=3155273 RepID=UPI0033F4849A